MSREHKIRDLTVPDESLKPFGDVKAPTPDDDAKNRFQLHEEAKRKARTGTAHDEHVAELEEQRRRWTHRTDVPTTASGVALTPEIQELKKASDASRAEERNPRPAIPAINAVTLLAVTRLWYTDTESGRAFPNIPFNQESLSNAVQYLLVRGAAVSLDTVERAYQLCLDGNHIDHARRDADGSLIRVRGGKFFTPPSVFPPTVWEDERQAIAAQAAETALREADAETARAKAMSFEDLQRETRSQFRSQKPGEVV